MITLNYRDARPIYEQVCDGLRRLIVSGAIADGDKLPSEGYSHESGIPFGEGLIKNRYVGRTFIEPTQELRAMGVSEEDIQALCREGDAK